MSPNIHPQIDFYQKHKENTLLSDNNGLSSSNNNLVSGQRTSSKKGFYIPNANISVVEKNPMNITIYNIRNSASRGGQREDNKGSTTAVNEGV
jgi:hypothetical protein